jgi:lipid-binding SYLF domain-containing protein
MQANRLLTAIAATILGMLVSATSFADSKAEIDVGVEEALKTFYAYTPANKDLADRSAGMLIFPEITKGGVGIGGEYGEGVLQVKGKTVSYYSISSGSIGLTLGVAKRSEILLFMTQDSLDKFTKSQGWSVGADAGVALMSQGAGGTYDSKSLQRPILVFVFGEKGLIGDLSIEGSKIKKIER